jgi:hypothetical protein
MGNDKDFIDPSLADHNYRKYIAKIVNANYLDIFGAYGTKLSYRLLNLKRRKKFPMMIYKN